jgi:hypothetical protein
MPSYPLQSGGGTLQNVTLQSLTAMVNAVFGTPGQVWWVNPYTGSDANDGKTPATAFATLTQAHASATDSNNDVVYLIANSNTASQTTCYLNDNLVWSKNLLHLIGVNGSPLFSQRSRIAFSAAFAAAKNLFTLSGNGCLMQGLEFFEGVASTLPTGCLNVTGARNHFLRCHIAGMGNAANDISGAYSLNFAGAEENFFEDCTIGQDTIQLGAGTSNQVLNFAANAPANTRNWFRECRFLLNTSSATACLFARGGGVGNLDRATVFEDCLFLNAIASGSTTLTHAMAIATGGGVVILTGPKTGLYGASGWNTNSGVVYATGGPQPTNTTFGLATAITS